MTHEKIIKDQRGEVRIVVTLWVAQTFQRDREGHSFRYDARVMHKAPRKRSEVFNENIATAAEILETKMELYNLIKPQ